MPAKETASMIFRKVLRHGDFGLCVLLPKAEWAKLPAKGKATVTVNGTNRIVTVQVESCNCRGNGWHEHRFLSLPPAAVAKAGQVVTLGLA